MEFHSADDDIVGYPRPQLRRNEWWCLNGPWDFAVDPAGQWQQPAQVAWTGTIEVPFAPETSRSGIGETGLYKACWYRRTIRPPALGARQRWIVHFNACDYSSTVWINSACAGRHEGGFTPFSFDITDFLEGREEVDIVVRAVDDPNDLQQPRGKQDWHLQPHLIWYPRTSGIWQTVWMERVMTTHITEVRHTPHLSRWELGLYVGVQGPDQDLCSVKATIQAGNRLLARDVYSVCAGEVHRRIALSDPGIDDSRNELLWSPASPTLIDVRLELLNQQNEVLDVVNSYTALREVSIQGDRVILNGRAVHLRLVLDQGYWPDTGMTPPDDAAARRNVELAKEMGFNGVRKHQKIEDPRYLYWADRLGLLVWEEMPSAYRFTVKSIERLTRQWAEVLRRDFSHPCIIAWVPFNESWGVPNLPDNAAERHYVQALYHLTKTMDPTRPVVGNDGWESVSTDIIGIHDYDDDPKHIARRYETSDVRVRLFKHERPGGRLLTLQEMPRRTIQSCCRNSEGSPCGMERAGAIREPRRPAILNAGTQNCSGPSMVCKRWQDFATPNSPIPTKKRTACSTPTDSQSFPWSAWRKPLAARRGCGNVSGFPDCQAYDGIATEAHGA